MIYYCVYCKKEVLAITGYFNHPDLGRIKGKICPHCGKPVMLGGIPA